ncbi:hypothetical protein EON66_01565, partial [archaeon]
MHSLLHCHFYSFRESVAALPLLASESSAVRPHPPRIAKPQEPSSPYPCRSSSSEAPSSSLQSPPPTQWLLQAASPGSTPAANEAPSTHAAHTLHTCSTDETGTPRLPPRWQKMVDMGVPRDIVLQKMCLAGQPVDSASAAASATHGELAVSEAAKTATAATATGSTKSEPT